MAATAGSSQVLQCENPVPLDFRLTSSEKFAIDKDELRNERRKVRKTKESFLMASHFLNDAILGSGKVLFNDPVSDYINLVLDVLLADDPELRKRVRAFAMKSTSVNAFVTDDGVILVNLGLISRLESEAQLAFILAHELNHYVEQHVLDAFVMNKDIFEGKGGFKGTSVDDRVLAQNLYSKELEMKADSAALTRMLRTKYDPREFLKVFEILRYSQIPYEQRAIPFNLFDQPYFVVDSLFFLDQVRVPQAREGDIDNLNSTHPIPRQREELVRSRTKDIAPAGSAFLVGEDLFKQARSLARGALPELYLAANDPVMAAYLAYNQNNDEKDNRQAQKTLARALYHAYKYKNKRKNNVILPGFNHVEGEVQQLYHLLYRLDSRETNVLAVLKLHELAARSNDPDMTDMAKDALTDLIDVHDSRLPFAMELSPELKTADPLGNMSDPNERSAWTRYSLTPLFQDSVFKKDFLAARARLKDPSTRTDRSLSFRENKKKSRNHRKHGFSIGADTVVFVTPQYGRFDLRKGNRKLSRSSERSKKILQERIERAAELVRVEDIILSRSELDSLEAETFNDMAFLNDWVDERFKGMELDMVPMHRQRLDALIEKYGTEHFAWTGVLNYRERKPFLFFYVLYALVPPALPATIYYLARPNYDSYYFCIGFNLKTGDPEMINYNNFKQKDARDMINSNVYDSLYQLKRKPKKKR